MSMYHIHRDAMRNISRGLEELDDTEAMYCKSDCEEEDCEDLGHRWPPDELFKTIAQARHHTKAALTITMAAMMAEDNHSVRGRQ